MPLRIVGEPTRISRTRRSKIWIDLSVRIAFANSLLLRVSIGAAAISL